MSIYVIDLITEDGDSFSLVDVVYEDEENALEECAKLKKRNKDFCFAPRECKCVEEI